MLKSKWLIGRGSVIRQVANVETDRGLSILMPDQQKRAGRVRHGPARHLDRRSLTFL